MHDTKNEDGTQKAPEDRATESIAALVSPKELKALDALLDGRPRSRWLRKLIQRELEAV